MRLDFLVSMIAKDVGVKKDLATVGKQIIREYNYAYQAFSPKDGVVDFLILPNIDGENMNIFLEELSLRHKDQYILLFCDKAALQKEGVFMVTDNIKLQHLPPILPTA